MENAPWHKTILNEKMSADAFETALLDMFLSNDAAGYFDQEIRQAETFAEAGVMTRNKGLVIVLGDGSKFQLTIA